MNLFTQMADTLAKQNSFPLVAPIKKTDAGTSRTESIRNLLREATRPLTAAEIAFALDLPNNDRVWLLIKYDMKKGRALQVAGGWLWNHDYDTKEAQELRDAVKLLERHGYKVKEPAA